MNAPSLFAEVEVSHQNKHGEAVCGDAFFSQRFRDEGRVIGVVSDGLGSGIKATLLANMTAKMALLFAASNLSIRRSADIIMDSLPVCRVRRISYATFTIVDSVLHGRTSVVEMGNPPFLFVRDGRVQPVEKQQITSDRWPDRTMSRAEFDIRPEDRLIVVTDGITQAGLGGNRWKLGWRTSGCAEYIERYLARNPNVSARRLAHDLVREAVRKDERMAAADDMTCVVFYFRQPRRLMVASGPPFDESRDAEVAQTLERFPGRRVICGGTTANIVARELGRTIETPLGRRTGDLPPVSSMAKIDLVTEGILTLTRAAQYLESEPDDPPQDAAAQLVEILRENDVIQFVVGTRINEAHQDPTLPIDLEIRRNIIKRIRTALIERYRKEVSIEYV